MRIAGKYAALRWRLAQRLEGLWWRRYLRDQTPNEYLIDKKAYWQRTLAELAWEVESNIHVLDAGCGPAGIFIHLHDRQHVTALDPLLLEYEANLAIFSRRRYPAVNFHAGRLEEALPGEPTFDAIYCFNAINHVADWGRALDQLTAYARPGTRMLLTSDVHRHAILQPIFRYLPGDALHPQQHLAEQYRTALAARGWAIDKEVELRRQSIFSYRAWSCTYRGS